MAGLDDIVSMVLSATTQQVSRAGFGVPLILGSSQRFAELVRTYTALSEMVSDGFVTTDPEYLAAARICAQSPKPSSFKVGRRTHHPTMVWDWTPLAVHSRVYTLTIDGTAVTVTSDSSSTVQEIVELMKAAVDVAAPADITATEDNAKVVLTAGTAGRFHRVWMPLRDIASGLGNIAQVNVDGGIATDLGDILLYDPDWYALVLASSQSKAEIVAAAAWVESNSKLLIAASQDSEIATVVDGSATDVAKAIETAGYARTAVFYHPKSEQYGDAGWEGKVLPLDPGSETWNFKTIAGLDVCTELTPTMIANIKAKHANCYPRVGGIGITRWGWVAANEWIDIIRFRDWLMIRMQERLFGSLANAIKIAFTDKGIAIVESDMRAQLQEGVDVGGLESFEVTVPKASTISAVDKAARHLATPHFNAPLAGAIHDLAITGTLYYSGT